MKQSQLLDRIPWSIWGVVLRNWSTLLCFEVFYRIFGFEILFPWLRRLISLLPGLTGAPYLGQNNILSVFRHPISFILVLFVVLLAALFVYFEIAALFIYCEKGWRREPLTVWGLTKETALQIWNLLPPKRLAVFLLLPPMTLSVFALTSGYLQKVKVPEFILEFLKGEPALFLLFSAVVILSHLLLLTYLYGFPFLLLEKETFLSSWQKSFRLLRNKKRRTAKEIAAYLLLLVLTVIVFVFSVIMLTALRVRCFFPPEDARSQFQTLISTADDLWTSFSGAFLSAFLCAVMVSLYHERREDIRPRRERGKLTWRNVTFRAAVLLGTLLLVTLFSETEVGGWRRYTPEQATEVVAHRAGAGFAPENTVSALKQAAEDGAHMAEIDVQQLKDGTLIVMHDTNFLRTAGVDLPVWDAEFSDLERMNDALSFGGAVTTKMIPTLAHMLSAAKGHIQLMIELKSTGHETDLVEQTLALIKKYDMGRQCVIASMEMGILEKAKSLNPRIGTVYISALLLTDQYNLKDIDAYSLEVSSLNAELVYQAHLQGKKVYAWTADTEKSIDAILYIQADGIVTDNVPLAFSRIRGEGKNSVFNMLTDFLFPVD